MTSLPYSLSLLLAALGLGALTAAAQSTDATATAAPPGPPGASAALGVPPPGVFTASGQVVPTPTAPPAEDEHGDHRQIQSAELTDALTSAMPKYAPPAATPPEPEVSDADKPKNGVIRLPQYVVREAKPPVFTERESMTKQGLNDLAMKRYLGLDPSKMNSPLAAAIARVMFQSYANQQYSDAERLSNISDLNSSAAAMARGGDTAESDYIKRESDDTYARGMESEQSGLDDHAGWGAPVPSEAATMGNAH
jgi:hypothetical protein